MLGDRIVVALLVLVMFTSGADLLVMTPLLPAVARDLGVGADLGGLWITAYAVATGLFALVFGPVSDRFGRRRVLQVGMAVLTVGTVVCAFANSFETMLAARSLAGAGAGMLVTSTTSFAGDHFESEQRAVAMGWVMSGFFLALIVAVPIGAWLAGAFGWSRMFLILSAFAGVLALGLLALPVPRFEERTATLSLPSAAQAYGELLWDRRVAGVLAMSFSIGLSMTMFSVYTSPWLATTFGLDTQARGLVYAAGGPAVLLGAPLAGRLSNHFGRVSLVLAGSLLMGSMQLLMPLTGWLQEQGRSAVEDFSHWGHGPWPLLVPPVLIFFMCMAAGATRSAPFQTLTLEVARSSQRGTVSALRNSSNQLGSGLGAAFGGFLWSAFDHPYVVICVLCAGVTFAGAVALRQLVGQDRPMASSSDPRPNPAVGNAHSALQRPDSAA